MTHHLQRLAATRAAPRSGSSTLGAPDGIVADAASLIQSAVSQAAIAQAVEERLPPEINPKEFTSNFLASVAKGAITGKNLTPLVQQGFAAGGAAICASSVAAATFAPLCAAAGSLVGGLVAGLFDNLFGSSPPPKPDNAEIAWMAVRGEPSTHQSVQGITPADAAAQLGIVTYTDLRARRDQLLVDSLALFGNDDSATAKLTELLDTYFSPYQTLADFRANTRFWADAGDSVQVAQGKIAAGQKTGRGGGCYFSPTPANSSGCPSSTKNTPWAPWSTKEGINKADKVLFPEMQRRSCEPLVAASLQSDIWTGMRRLMFGYMLPFLDPQLVMGVSYLGTWRVRGFNDVGQGAIGKDPIFGAGLCTKTVDPTAGSESDTVIKGLPIADFNLAPKDWAVLYYSAISMRLEKGGLAFPVGDLIAKAKTWSGSYWEQRAMMMRDLQRQLFPALQLDLKRRLEKAYVASTLNAKVALVDAIEVLSDTMSELSDCKTATCASVYRNQAVAYAQKSYEVGPEAVMKEIRAQFNVPEPASGKPPVFIKMPGLTQQGGVVTYIPGLTPNRPNADPNAPPAPAASSEGGVLRPVIALAIAGAVGYGLHRWAKRTF